MKTCPNCEQEVGCPRCGGHGKHIHEIRWENLVSGEEIGSRRKTVRCRKCMGTGFDPAHRCRDRHFVGDWYRAIFETPKYRWIALAIKLQDCSEPES